MSIFRAQPVTQLRGLLRHTPQARTHDAFSSRPRMSIGSIQRLQGHRDLRVHRQSDRAWRPPRASNEHLSGMQQMKESLSRENYRYPQMTPAQTYASAQAYNRSQGASHSKVGASAAKNQTGSGSGGHHFGGGMFLSYHDLELALERRGLNAVRFLLSVAGAIALVIGLMWPRIKKWGAAEGAEVAAASLQQEELKKHATALVNALIAEPKTTKQVESMLKAALLSLLEDEDLKQEATKWTADVFAEAMMWPRVLAKGTEYVESVLKDEKSIDYAYDYFAKAAQLTAHDEKVQDAASHALWSSIRGMFGRRKSAPIPVPQEVSAEPIPVPRAALGAEDGMDTAPGTA